MKLKLSLLAAFLFSITNSAFALDEGGFRFINAQGKVRCGVNLSYKDFAHKDSDGQWVGYAADWCKVFSKFVFDRYDLFEIVNIDESNVEAAFRNKQIDFAIGIEDLGAGKELNSATQSVDTILFDNQAILAKTNNLKNTLTDFNGDKLCVVRDSTDYYNINKSNNNNFTLFPVREISQAKENFLLNRCPVMTANRLYLASVLSDFSNRKDLQIIDDSVAAKPFYVYVHRDNNKLRLISKWIINAFKLAEDNGITSQNIQVMQVSQDTSLQNMLGNTPDLWKSMGARNPNWVLDSIKEYGNFGEMYERNFGKDSIYKFDRKENRLIKDGGLMEVKPFL